MEVEAHSIGEGEHAGSVLLAMVSQTMQVGEAFVQPEHCCPLTWRTLSGSSHDGSSQGHACSELHLER